MAPDMPHDFAAQRAETAATHDALQAEHGLPDVADVEFFFIPASDGTDWKPLAQVLTDTGFVCEYFTPENAQDTPYLMATLPDQIISAAGIWIGEEMATRAALDHGFLPDGWGMQG